MDWIFRILTFGFYYYCIILLILRILLLLLIVALVLIINTILIISDINISITVIYVLYNLCSDELLLISFILSKLFIFYEFFSSPCLPFSVSILFFDALFCCLSITIFLQNNLTPLLLIILLLFSLNCLFTQPPSLSPSLCFTHFPGPYLHIPLSSWRCSLSEFRVWVR